jgi:hypothetical protein
MPLSEDEKNDLKATVLLEIEKMFTQVSSKYLTDEYRETTLYLMDLEKAIKEPLMDGDI